MMATPGVSFQDLMDRFPLTPEQLNRVFSDDHLIVLSRFIEDHEIIGFELGLRSPDLNAINSDEKKQDLRKLKMLKKWKQKFAWEATYKKMIEAFLNRQKGLLAQKVCELLMSNKLPVQALPKEEPFKAVQTQTGFQTGATEKNEAAKKDEEVQSDIIHFNGYNDTTEKADEVQPSPSQVAEMEKKLQTEVKHKLFFLMEPLDLLVSNERKKLLDHIDLKSVAADLGHVGRCIRVAYNSLIVAGPTNFTGLQSEVHILGCDVAQLCDESTSTISNFKRTCETIIANLEITYQYLLHGYEELALGKLASVSKVAGHMATVTEKLQKGFEKAVKKARDVANTTKEKESDQNAVVKNKEKEEQELQIKLSDQQDVLENARRAEDEAKRRYHECEVKEDEATQSLGDDVNLLSKLVIGLTCIFPDPQFFSEDAQTQQKHWERKRLEALDLHKKRESMRKEAHQQLLDFELKIKKCKGEKEIALAAVEALHQAVDGLQMLATLMRHTVQFWKQVQLHCEDLEGDDMQQTVMIAKRMNVDNRYKIWTSPGFKQQAARFYTSWIALYNVCEECMPTIQRTQKDLDKYVNENPSYEDAEKNVKQLISEMKKEMREVPKAIEKGDY